MAGRITRPGAIAAAREAARRAREAATKPLPGPKPASLWPKKPTARPRQLDLIEWIAAQRLDDTPPPDSPEKA